MTSIKALWEKHGWWLSLLGVLVGVLGGGLGTGFVMFKYYASDVPELREESRKISESLIALREGVSKIDPQLQQLNKHRDETENTLKVVRAHLISIMQKVERRQLKAQEIKEMLGSIHEISTTESRTLTAHSALSGPDTPKIPAGIHAFLKARQGDLKPEIAGMFGWVGEARPGDRGAGATALGVREQLARAFITKNGSWVPTNDGIKFNYDGGSAIFHAYKGITPEELERKAELFNSVSKFVGETINSPELVPNK